MLLLDKMVGHIVPIRFLSFEFVGSTGLIVHMVILTALYKVAGHSFIAAQAAATFVAISNNFLPNNLLTNSDRRPVGWLAVRGWIILDLAGL